MINIKYPSYNQPKLETYAPIPVPVQHQKDYNQYSMTPSYNPSSKVESYHQNVISTV